MAQFAIAWVLQNKNVAAAIVGASKPEQITSNLAASGVVIPQEIMAKVDQVLGDVIERDPSKTKSPEARLC
jgi:aryl-alcohol dehydrogenase-like predicted oxidoreductase